MIKEDFIEGEDLEEMRQVAGDRIVCELPAGHVEPRLLGQGHAEQAVVEVLPAIQHVEQNQVAEPRRQLGMVEIRAGRQGPSQALGIPQAVEREQPLVMRQALRVDVILDDRPHGHARTTRLPCHGLV